MRMKGTKSTLVLQHNISGRAKWRKCKRAIEKRPRTCTLPKFTGGPGCVVFKMFLHAHCVPVNLRASVLGGVR